MSRMEYAIRVSEGTRSAITPDETVTIKGISVPGEVRKTFFSKSDWPGIGIRVPRHTDSSGANTGTSLDIDYFPLGRGTNLML